MRRSLIAVLLLLGMASCGSGQSFGPLTIDVPDGWRVTDRGEQRLQIADGTVASETETEPGDATAVFDLFLESAQTVQSLRDTHRTLEAEWSEDRLEVDGEEAIVFRATGEGVAGDRETVLIPAYRVLIIYRAAFPNDRNAFETGHEAFRSAVRSIRFSGDPIASPA